MSSQESLPGATLLQSLSALLTDTDSQESARASTLLQEIHDLSSYLGGIPQDLLAGGAFTAYQRRLKRLKQELVKENWGWLLALLSMSRDEPDPSDTTLPDWQAWLSRCEQQLASGVQLVQSLKGEVDNLAQRYPEGSIPDRERDELVHHLKTYLSRFLVSEASHAREASE